jgi:hypothetical protein
MRWGKKARRVNSVSAPEGGEKTHAKSVPLKFSKKRANRPVKTLAPGGGEDCEGDPG